MFEELIHFICTINLFFLNLFVNFFVAGILSGHLQLSPAEQLLQQQVAQQQQWVSSELFHLSIGSKVNRPTLCSLLGITTIHLM